jgi:FdrA protein
MTSCSWGQNCGTAILDGVGFGFANDVRRGPVGIVGASGTGIQEVSCLLDAAGVGISQAIGVGGRDLSLEVGGSMTIRALRLLASDQSTEAIVVISKRPDPEVANAVARSAAETRKPAVLAFSGGLDARSEGIEVASTLEEAARTVARIFGATLPLNEVAPAKVTEGASADSSLAARCVPRRWRLSRMRSARWRQTFLSDRSGASTTSTGARAIPSSTSETTDSPKGGYTRWVDYRLRTERIRAEATDPSVGVILLDVVLGFGANANPAAELAPAIEHAVQTRQGSQTIVASICGAASDPQDIDSQVRALERAGALVTRSNRGGALLALQAAGMRPVN